MEPNESVLKPQHGIHKEKKIPNYLFADVERGNKKKIGGWCPGITENVPLALQIRIRRMFVLTRFFFRIV